MTVGRRETVADLDADDLRAFHAEHLSARQSVLSIVGDFDPAKMALAVRGVFDDLPRKAEAPVDAPGPVKAEPDTHYVESAKPLTAVHIGFPPGLTRDSDDYPAMTVLTKVASNFPSGWLHQALRGEGPGLVYAAYAYNFAGLAPGYWAMAFNTSADLKDQAIQRSMAVVDRLKNENVDDATLQRAVSAAVVDEALGRQAPGQRAMAMALDELYGVGYAHSDEQVQRLRQVTAADIRQAANKYLNDPLTLILTNDPPKK
jgi:zinc protease